MRAKIEKGSMAFVSCALILMAGAVFSGCSKSSSGGGFVPPPAEGTFDTAVVNAVSASGGGFNVTVTNAGKNNLVRVGLRLVGSSSAPLLFWQKGTTDSKGVFTPKCKVVSSQIREVQSTNKYEVVVIVEDTASTASPKPVKEYSPTGSTSGSNVSVPAGHVGDKVRGVVGAAIQLQGESWVPNGDPVTHSWAVTTLNVPGTVTFSSTTALNPTVTGSKAATFTVRRTDTNTSTGEKATFDATVSIGDFVMNASATNDGSAANLTVASGTASGTFNIFGTGGVTGTLKFSGIHPQSSLPLLNFSGTAADDVILVVGGGTSTIEVLHRDANPYPISVVASPGVNPGELQITIVSVNGATEAKVSYQLEGTTGFVDLTLGPVSGSFGTGATYTVSGLPVASRGTLKVQVGDGSTLGVEYKRNTLNLPDSQGANFSLTQTSGVEVRVK